METATQGRTVRMVTKCRKCKTAHAEDIPAMRASEFYCLASSYGGGQEPYRRCRNCGAGLYVWHSIRGKLRPEKKCDGRCTSATGFDCECSCGGKNHGSDNL